MFGLFKKRRPSVIVVTLNARLQPMDRAALEDAFETAMKQRGHELEVVGGGTQMAADGEVIECDIELEIDGPSDATVDAISETLATMLAPKGSTLYVSDQDRRIEFGAHEGLALYLNGRDLPAEAYRDCDSNHVYAECGRLLEGLGIVSSHWQGPLETALYMYGWDFTEMQEKLTPFLQEYPLCQQSRVLQIA